MKIKAQSTPTVKNRIVIQYIICDAKYTKVLWEWNRGHINIKRKQNYMQLNILNQNCHYIYSQINEHYYGRLI